jgi:hypothetical protein
MFQARDVRGGAGNKDIFFHMYYFLCQLYPLLAYSLLRVVPEYGTWGDVFKIATMSPLMMAGVMELFEKQLLEDEQAVTEGRTPSLMAKWAPRENKSGAWVAKQLIAYIGRGSPPTTHLNAMYRRRLAALNHALGTVEVLECAGRWAELQPTAVPSRARRIKSAAYLRHECGDRFAAFYDAQATRTWAQDPHRYTPILDILEQNRVA